METNLLRFEWPKEAVLQLIALWQANECLYNSKHTLYHNKFARRKALGEVAAGVQVYVPHVTTSDVKNKITYLRGQYSREIARIRSEGVDVYVPGAFWFKELWFLDEFMKIRRGKETIPYLSDTNSCDRANDASICELPPKIKKTAEPKDLLDADICEPPIKMKKTNKPKDLLDADICEPPIKMKKTNKQTGVLDMSYLQKETDSFQHLGLAWAAKLRRMKPIQSKLAERLISEVLFRADLEMLTMDTTVENKNPPASTVSSSCYSQSSTPQENSADRHFRSISQLSANSHTNTNSVPSTSQDISPPTTSIETIFPTSLQGPVTYIIKEEEELHDCIGTSEE